MTKQQYIEYLIATPGNYTCTNLSDHLGGEQAVSHDAVSGFLRREQVMPGRRCPAAQRQPRQLFYRGR